MPPVRTANWGRYCGLYDACARPVYFVRDEWDRRTYAPQQLHANAGWWPGRERWAEHEQHKHQWREREWRNVRDEGDHDGGGFRR